MLEMKKAANMQVETNHIVVKRVSFAGKIFEIMMDMLYRIGKLILWMLVCLVLSIGVIALLNPTIRDTVLSYLPFIN